jgi:hypothetical protein
MHFFWDKVFLGQTIHLVWDSRPRLCLWSPATQARAPVPQTHYFCIDSNRAKRDSKSDSSLLLTSGSAKLYCNESRTIFFKSA